MKILITGATGFLGRNLIDRLRHEGCEMVLTAGHEDRSLGVQKVDLTDATEVLRVMAADKPELVYHIGAFVDLARNFDVARRCIETNLIGTTNLLFAAKEVGTVSRFVLASTEEVYGEGDLPYKEENDTHAPSPYAVSKLTSEHMCRIVAAKTNMSVCVFRIGTMYGPFMPNQRYIVDAIRKALKRENIPLNSGTKKRDYIYVDDVVDALITAGESPVLRGFQIMNLGGGINMTLQSLVEQIVELSGSTSRLQIGAIPDRISEADEWLLDNSRAKQLLGWKPKTDIRSGLTRTISFYKTQ